MPKVLTILLSSLVLGTPVWGVGPGDKAPAFRLADPSGKVYTLEGFKGRPLVLIFWASWCPVCKAEFPKLHALAQAYRRVPFVVISREPRDTREVVLNYMKDYPTFLPLLAVSGGDTPVAVANRYRVVGLPWTLILDGEGRVVGVHAGRIDQKAFEDDLALAGYAP